MHEVHVFVFQTPSLLPYHLVYVCFNNMPKQQQSFYVVVVDSALSSYSVHDTVVYPKIIVKIEYFASL